MTDNVHRAREPKFGDWIRGIYASERNPIRDGIYVRTTRRNHETLYELTDGKGKFWMYPKQSTERLNRPNAFDAAALRLAVPEWRPIETAPRDELILVGPTKRMGICVAMHHSRDGWVTETTGDWFGIYTPTHWMPLPAAPRHEPGEG